MMIQSFVHGQRKQAGSKSMRKIRTPGMILVPGNASPLTLDVLYVMAFELIFSINDFQHQRGGKLMQARLTIKRSWEAPATRMGIASVGRARRIAIDIRGPWSSPPITVRAQDW
jgi:hypothetical protein